MPDAKRKYKRTTPEYAAAYGVSHSTIIRLRRDNVNLDDPAEVRRRFSAQKNRPKSAFKEVTFDGEEGEGSGSATDDKLYDARVEKTLLECRRLEHKLEVERGAYTKNEVIRAELQRLLAEHCAALRQAFENEAPAKCSGLGAAQIQLVMRETLDRVLGTLSAQMQAQAPDAAVVLEDAPEDLA